MLEQGPQPSPVDLVILDCDGVLVDTERIGIPVIAQLLREHGADITENEIVRRFLGGPHLAFGKTVADELGVPADWDANLETRWEEAFRTSLTPVDGIVAALDALMKPT